MAFTMAEKNKIKTEYAKRYRKANKPEKTEILDNYLKLPGGGSRKHAVFTLNREGKKQPRLIGGKYANAEVPAKTRRKRACKPYYDDETAEAFLSNSGSSFGISAESAWHRF
jgi:hypothetical protein